MDREEAIRLIRRHEGEIREHGVAALSLFGSTARGEGRPDSDVDILVDIPEERKFSLFDLSGLRLYLCDLFGREADVVVRRGLGPRMANRVKADELRVF